MITVFNWKCFFQFVISTKQQSLNKFLKITILKPRTVMIRKVIKFFLFLNSFSRFLLEKEFLDTNNIHKMYAAI